MNITLAQAAHGPSQDMVNGDRLYYRKIVCLNAGTVLYMKI